MSIVIYLLLTPHILSGQSFEKTIDQIVKQEPSFNGVILLAKNGQPVYHKAFGYRDYASRTALKKTDIFELASISKQFTAFVIMKLVEEGKLDYDDLVEKYLDIPYKGITIRHLLTHTSGLPDYQEVMDRYWDKNKVAGNPDILEYLNRYRPPAIFEPGNKYEYSNTGYVLLASIAEKSSGEDFIQLCRKWIFIPAAMKNTGIRSPEEKKATGNFTSGHIYVDSLHRYVRADSFPSSDYTIWLGNRKGPGRVSAASADLLLWDQALYSGKLIRKEVLTEAYQPMRLNDGSYSYYGFGWMLPDSNKNGKVVKHTGSNPGYSTQIIRYLEKNRTIIILSNNAYDNINGLIEKLESGLLSL